jgi:O-antigen ligase
VRTLFLLTQYNAALPGLAGRPGLDPGWLDARLRLGLLDDRTDRLLFVLAIALPVLDFSQTSWWATDTKPLGDAQRWLTVIVQAAYISANAAAVVRFCREHAAFLALVAFVAASAAWSVDPGTTLQGATRLLLLGTSILVGQDRHGGKLPVAAFRDGCCVILLANFAALALPSVSIMGGTLAGAFRGLTDHKNTLGQFGALALPFVLAPLAAPCPPRKARALLLMALLILVTIALTRSATSVLLAATALAVFGTARIGDRTGLPTLARLLVGSFLAIAGLLWADGLFDPFRALSRDATLTGRAEIWGFVDLCVRQHPWLGFGYRAFPLTDLLRIDPRWGLDSYIVGSTHNAYLAIVTEIGYLGLAVYGAWLLAFLAGRFPRRDAEARLLAAMVVPVYIISGLTESIAGLAPDLYLAGLLIACGPRPASDQIPRRDLGVC